MLKTVLVITDRDGIGPALRAYGAAALRKQILAAKRPERSINHACFLCTGVPFYFTFLYGERNFSRDVRELVPWTFFFLLFLPCYFDLPSSITPHTYYMSMCVCRGIEGPLVHTG